MTLRMSTELLIIRPVFTGFYGDGGNRTHAKCLPNAGLRPVVGVGSEDQIGPARWNARPVATEDQAPMRAEGYSATQDQRKVPAVPAVSLVVHGREVHTVLLWVRA